MALFGQLDDNFFLIFSRGNRHFYAHVIMDLFDRFFSDAVTFPGKLDVVGAIYDALKMYPELWTDEHEDFSDVAEIRTKGRRFKRSVSRHDDRQDVLLDRAHLIYGQLIDKGWLEEETFGIRVTVDMTPGAMLLAERLAAIAKGLATTFRGVVITIRNAMASVLQDPRTNALGLNKAAELAIRFSRELRAVLSHLRTIERDILQAEDLVKRFATFFEEFIDRLVLKDFESIYKTNHPYRFKREILEAAGQVADEGHVRDQVVEGYVEGEVASDVNAAGMILDADLSTIRVVFDNIDQTYERINGFRIRLEARLRNMIKYAEIGDQLHSQRLSRLIVRLDQAVADLTKGDPKWLSDHQPKGLVMEAVVPWAPYLLAEPRGPRQPVSAGLLRRPEYDPVLAEWRDRLRRYNDLFIDDVRRVRRFLEARILPDGMGEARYLAIETVEDFLVFEHLRRLRRAPPAMLTEHFELGPCPDTERRDDEWIGCENFLIYRKTGHLSLTGKQPL
jgi:hypothetical protein